MKDNVIYVECERKGSQGRLGNRFYDLRKRTPLGTVVEILESKNPGMIILGIRQ